MLYLYIFYNKYLFTLIIKYKLYMFSNKHTNIIILKKNFEYIIKFEIY